MQFVRNFSALFLQNPLHFPETSCIITNVVTLIAVKREVAAQKWQVFRGANVKLGNWRQVTVQTEILQSVEIGVPRCMNHKGHTRKRVQSPLVVLH